MAKYVLIIPDGAADEPQELFNGQTVLEAAYTPNMDRISTQGRQGMANTVPDGFDPGSDVAQMTLLGYDARRYYSGRAPIEAAAQDIALGPNDWVFRCNLVTFANDEMADHSAGQISTEEGRRLIEELADHLGMENIEFHTGVSYRHLMVCREMEFEVQTYTPHDNIGRPVEKLLPRGKGADRLRDLMLRSMKFFASHDINRVRNDLGENPVSSIWLWGQGKQARLESFHKRHSLRGATITAVDLVRGLARLVGFDLIEVDGATGFADTNYAGKGAAAIDALEKYDFVFVHIEAPDEAGHEGNAELKKKTIEQIDKHIVGPIHEALGLYEQWRILVMPDHPTPVRTRAHTADPIPFAMDGTAVTSVLKRPFGESNATESGFCINKGHELMEYFLKL
jgi:2,3-bisphosphoglycerate-independent phosphoglycerate mutase